MGATVVGDLDPEVMVANYFEAETFPLGPGRYTVTIAMTENTDVAANEQVPEPGTILLVGAGLLV